GGKGEFSGGQTLERRPGSVVLQDSIVGMADVTGDGYPDVLEFLGDSWGYYPGLLTGGWGEFLSFKEQPLFGLQDTNLRFVDLTGDGKSDVLRTDPDQFVAFESRATCGFGPPKRRHASHDPR